MQSHRWAKRTHTTCHIGLPQVLLRRHILAVCWERPKQTWKRTVIEEATNFVIHGKRLKGCRRTEPDGGALQIPYVPNGTEGLKTKKMWRDSYSLNWTTRTNMVLLQLL
jgi:hypothetical protein